MEKIIAYLTQLELSELEAKLYLTLLQTGPISVRELAANIDIKRTTAYLYIDQLVEKGLVIKLIKGSSKLIAAEEPTNLEGLVRKKVDQAKDIQEKLPSILKTIETSLPHGKDIGDAEIKYYKGKNGVKKIYEEALKSKELRSYVNIEEIVQVFPENFELFNNAFKQNPGLVMYEICEDSSKAKERIGTSSKKHLYKILPKEMKFSAQDILIYKDTIAIIHFKDSINGIVLKNEDLYNNFRLLFDFVWKILPD